jgi:hypothetical protein
MPIFLLFLRTVLKALNTVGNPFQSPHRLLNVF